MEFIAFDDSEFSLKGEYAVWNTEKTVKVLSDVVKNNGGVISLDDSFFSLKYTTNRICIKTSQADYLARLSIDCMGYSSPIVHAKGIVKIYGYYILHGMLMEMSKVLNPVGLHNVMLQREPSFLEVFPLNRDRAYVTVIKPLSSLTEKSNIQRDFKFITRDTRYKDVLKVIPAGSEKGRNVESSHFVGGVVPVGRLQKTALDRIFFYGLSAQVNPAASATALTRILENYVGVAARIQHQLDCNKLQSHDLKPCLLAHLNGFNRSFQLSLFKDILHWNSDDFRLLIEWMNELDGQIVHDMIFSQLRVRDLPILKSLKFALYRRNFLLLKPVLTGLLKQF